MRRVQTHDIERLQSAMDTARAAYEQMTKASAEAFQAFTKITPKK